MNYTTLNKAKLIASQKLINDYLKNGGAYMAQNKLLNLDESSTQNLTTKSKGVSRSVEDTKQYIKDTIVTIKSKHNQYMPKLDWSKYESELKTKEYNGPSATELGRMAEDKFANYKESSINKIMADYDTDKSGIESEQQSLTQDYQQDKSNLDSDIISRIESNQQRAISQGIQESSILTNQQNAEIKNYESENLRIDSEYNADMSALEMKRNLVEAQKELALENFDIAYANKLNSEINKLTNEQNKIKAEIEKHNADVEKRKQEIQKEFEKENAEKIAQVNDDIQRDIVSKTFDILKTMPRSEALRVLKDPEIAEAIGDWMNAMNIWLRDY